MLKHPPPPPRAAASSVSGLHAKPRLHQLFTHLRETRGGPPPRINHFDFSGAGVYPRFKETLATCLGSACKGLSGQDELEALKPTSRGLSRRGGRRRGGADRRSDPFSLSPLISEVSAATLQAAGNLCVAEGPGGVSGLIADSRLQRIS